MAEPDSSNNYKFDLDVSAKAKEFGSKSGKYSVSLIVGDAVVSNPINWNLADISLKFPGMYTRGLTKFWDHSGVWPKVSLVFEDFQFNISEG